MSERNVDTKGIAVAGVPTVLSTSQATADGRYTCTEQHLSHELEVHQVELEMQNAELREARCRLETSLREFVEFFNCAPVAYVVLNERGIITQVNRRACQLLGIRPHHILDSAVRALISPQYMAAFDVFWGAAWGDVNHEGLLSPCEVVMLTSHVPNRLVDVRMTGTLFTKSSIGTLLVALENITERRKFETELQSSEQELLVAHRNKDDFLATLAHELRNPLSPIRSSLEILQQSRSDTAMRERALNIIGRQVDHMSSLVDELLDVSRISRAKVRLRLECVNLTQLVLQTIDDHLGLCQDQGIEVSVDANTPIWVNGDPARLVQIVSNVLTNAIKFTPAAGQIRIVLVPFATMAVLTVFDTGAGIDGRTLAHIFEPFVQGRQSIERSRGGLGLGLATVKGFVELQGGEVSLTSPGIGLGTHVEIKLPTRAAPEAVESPPEEAHEKPCRLVVIDDNLDAAESLCDYLSSRGHCVESANDGRSGLQLVRKLVPQAVICDIGLPVMDGYAVAKAIREDARLDTIYLIALTGYAHPKDVQLAKLAGFNAHLVKPCSTSALTSALRALPG